MDKRLDKLIGKSLTKSAKLFPKEMLYKFVNSPREELELYRYSIGSWIIENILVDNCRIYREFIKNGITRKDKMSLYILEYLYNYFNPQT